MGFLNGNLPATQTYWLSPFSFAKSWNKESAIKDVREMNRHITDHCAGLPNADNLVKLQVTDEDETIVTMRRFKKTKKLSSPGWCCKKQWHRYTCIYYKQEDLDLPARRISPSNVYIRKGTDNNKLLLLYVKRTEDKSDVPFLVEITGDDKEAMKARLESMKNVKKKNSRRRLLK